MSMNIKLIRNSKPQFRNSKLVIRNSKLVLCFVLLLTVVHTSMAQGVIDRNHVPSTERVDPFERRSDVIDANNIRATITNWAQTANSGNPGDFLYEWPKNTNQNIYSLISTLGRSSGQRR